MRARTVRIEKLVAGAYGLGHLDGQVILVPYSAPGDELLIEVAPTRRGVRWGKIVQIVSPSPARTSPFCAHYTQCGGCQLQHISYAAQLEHKRLIVDDTLRHLAGLKEAVAGSCIESPLHMGYRNRVRLHCHRENIGFYRSGSKAIIPVEYCPVLSDGISTCLKQISSYIVRHPVRDLSEIQITEDTDSRVIITLTMESLPGSAFVDTLRDNVDVSGALVRVGHRGHLLWGEEYSTISVEGRSFRAGTGSFFQANISLLPTLIQEVLRTVAVDDIDMGVELYAGVGVFSIMLSESVRRLVAVEWNRNAVEDAMANLDTNRIRNVDVIPLSAEGALDLLCSRKIKPELVVTDPPREGLSSTVCRKLLRLEPRQLIYISCDPATLARDIRFILASGAYRLEKIKPLDMFPHTSHIESVCSFVRN